MENFWCEVQEKAFLKGPCLHEKGRTEKGNKTCPECTYWKKNLFPPKELEESRTSLSSRGTGKKTGADVKEKYRKKSCTPRLNKSPINRNHQELKPTQMRLDDSDRLMATARRPDYIEDWKELISAFSKRKKSQTIKTLHKRLCQKWKLKSPIPPHLGKEGKDWETIFKANQLEAILELTENEWPNSLYASLSEAIGKCVFVRLKIDLTRSQKELLKAFSEKIKSWTKNISKETKPRKPKEDPWEIWDLYKKTRSLLAIARQKSGKRYLRGKKTPVYNEELWPPYKRVKRAYDQAKEMIQAAKPLYPFPIKTSVDV